MSTTINQEQLDALANANLKVGEERVLFLLNEENLTSLSINDLEETLKIANAAYRAGVPLIDDHVYDHVFLKELATRDPQHPFLTLVEPEPVHVSKTVALPQKMLSTDKAYSEEDIIKWIDRLKKAADEIDLPLSELMIRVTPKLDGYAAYDDGETLYTRGDGVRGQDITRAFARGMQVAEQSARGQGAGEIVIKKSYFEQHLNEHFENSRNIQAAIIAEKKVDERVQKAIDDGAVVFYPFAAITNWQGHFEALLKDFDEVTGEIWSAVDFDVDGVILEATHDELKQHMGATRHHHRWQIAYKSNVEKAEVKVIKVTPQTSRTGRISPVAELEPTRLSGATISRATVHHYGMVKSNGVGPGAVVQLVRSGLVIPKIEEVLQPVEPEFPEECPSCGSHVVWDGDHIICPNTTECPAQTENTMIHFFKTLGNIDGFGPATIAILNEKGVRSIHEIYQSKVEDFVEMGFGDKTSENLVNQLAASRSIEIEDWRFLAAFGVVRLGPGNCERLLEHHDIETIFDVSVEDMVKIDGFAELSAQTIAEGLKNIKHEFFQIFNLQFNLRRTEKLGGGDGAETPITGKQVVFTGSMVSGPRGDMEKQAKALGAKVGKSVSGKTDYLVTGEKVGANKINAAKEKGVTVLTESEYLAMING
ncbi:helix-hairpin-helix domain-containing protein [Pleionea sp. CnH1-48]|uniref:helix-hairpin-helix domain-containing protein n=1 Tax=Pleionea sp. CnH1-48 TaxID=2954494 RepID=UPI0020975176|nr:helix-hairpin-helix domain-containing protein [Pleionea sp. CnH1-48]MCO7226831.1 helix-hairpin-helix domain-containing protein [Pleionea sp. CnH1-48]